MDASLVQAVIARMDQIVRLISLREAEGDEWSEERAMLELAHADFIDDILSGRIYER